MQLFIINLIQFSSSLLWKFRQMNFEIVRKTFQNRKTMLSIRNQKSSHVVRRAICKNWLRMIPWRNNSHCVWVNHIGLWSPWQPCGMSEMRKFNFIKTENAEDAINVALQLQYNTDEFSKWNWNINCFWISKEIVTHWWLMCCQESNKGNWIAIYPWIMRRSEKKAK